MKSYFTSVFAAILMAATSLSAVAGPLDKNFNAVNSSGTSIVFQVESAYSVEKVTGMVQVTGANSSVQYYQDPTGALYNKIVASPEFARTFYQIQGTLFHINVLVPTYIQCYSNQSTFVYASTGYMKHFADGCVNFNSIKSQSN